MGNAFLPMALGRTSVHSKVAARALLISVLEGQGRKGLWEEREREKRTGKREGGQGRQIGQGESCQSNPFTSSRNIHVPITSCKNIWTGQLLARLLTPPG